MCQVALSQPINGTVEIGGPERSHLDEMVRKGLAASKDPREVVVDPHGRYYGIEIKERTLVPDEDGSSERRGSLIGWLNPERKPRGWATR
jgi:hypothetical protein